MTNMTDSRYGSINNDPQHSISAVRRNRQYSGNDEERISIISDDEPPNILPDYFEDPESVIESIRSGQFDSYIRRRRFIKRCLFITLPLIMVCLIAFLAVYFTMRYKK